MSRHPADAPTMIYHHRTQGVDAQGIHIHEMNNAFARQGYSVQKVSIYDDEAVGQESRTGILSRIVAHLPAFLYELLEIGYNIVGTLRLVQVIRSKRPQLIYERYSLYNFSGVVASRITKTPLILEVNAPLAYEKSRYGKVCFPSLAQKIETTIINSATQTIAVTEVLRGMLIEKGGRADSIVVMHNGVNLKEYPELAAMSEQAKKAGSGNQNNKATELRPPALEAEQQDLITLGFVGWFRDWHGLSEMLIALDKQGAFTRNVHLKLIGDGPLRSQLEELIAQRNLASHVTITGALSRQQLLQTLPTVDIALQPAATSYASPMKLFEYMAAGKAIVAPAQPNIEEILQDGENGLLFSPGNWQHMTARVMELVTKPKDINRLGKAAQQTILQRNHTWNGNAEKTLALLKNN